MFTENDLIKMGLTRQVDGSYAKKNIPLKKITKKNREQNQQEIHQQIKVDGDITISWANKHISLNKWYSSEHWSKRDKQKKEWHAFFYSIFPKPLPVINQYEITLIYNSNLDPSNTITMVKLCEDMMQEYKIITNDNKTYCKGIHLIPDVAMKKNTYKIIIKCHS